MPETNEIGCSYYLDEALTIVAVDDAWSRFALENEAPELLPPAPIGRPVLSYVADRTTAVLYDRLFRKVLQTSAAITVPLRCDAPALRRFLELEIAPWSPRGLRITSVVLRTEARPAVAELERWTERGEPCLRMCTFCKRVEVGQQWCEVETLLNAQRLFERAVPSEITHVVCDDCGRLIEERLE